MDPLASLSEESRRRYGPRALWRKISASLSLKLLGIFIGGSIVLIMLLGGLFRFGLERQSMSAAAPLLNHYLHYLQQEVGDPASVDRAQALTSRWPVTIRIFDPLRDIRWASDGRLRQPQLHDWQQEDQSAPFSGQIYWDHGTALIKREIGSANVYFGVRFRPAGVPWFLLLMVTLVLLAVFGFYWFTRRLFAPIKQIQSGIERIGEGDLSHRIELHRKDELGALAGQVNRMSGQLESMLQAKRDLLLAISHELKSPMARSRVSLALLEESEYQQALLDDQKEMQALIDGIIDAERSQGNYAVLQRMPTEMAVLIDAVVERFEQQVEIERHCEPQHMTVDIDPIQIERLLRNLLENALRYNNIDRGPVQLYCRLDGNVLELQVIDHGPGIAGQHLERLTEAFYRVDPSRERKSGGLGLGLYLCQAVVNAHGGEMSIKSKPGQGARVLCRIPVLSEDN